MVRRIGLFLFPFVKRLAIGVLALAIGILGLIWSIRLGESYGGISAYVAGFAPLAVLTTLAAFGFGRLDPPGTWAYAALLFSPTVVLVYLEGGGQPELTVGAAVVTALTLAGAYLAQERARTQKPPSVPPSS